MIRSEAWAPLQQHSDTFTPGWSCVKGDTLTATGFWPPLKVGWYEGRLVPRAQNETAVGLYIGTVQILVTANIDGAPVLDISERAELVPIASATGMIMCTDKRIFGRLSRGHFVKTTLEPNSEILFAMDHSSIVQAELAWLRTRRASSRGASHVLLAAAGNSYGAMRISVTNKIQSVGVGPAGCFTPCGIEEFWSAFSIATKVLRPAAKIMAVPSGEQILEVVPSTACTRLIDRTKAALSVPWLSYYRSSRR